MPRNYILALDQGTTSSRAILFNHQGEPIGTAQQEFTQHFPHDGWVEHDAEEIWSSQCTVIRELLTQQQIDKRELAAVGITNQRETTVLWNRETGKPLHHAIVWQDRRTANLCSQLKQDGLDPTFREKTGLRLDPYFSGTKLKWLLDHIPAAREQAKRGQLAFGTIDSWLLWKLSNGRIHKTDTSNASRTLLCNIHTGQWDEELLEILDIPRQLLPEIAPSSSIFGEAELDCLNQVPIAALAGDQQAALFGQTCFDSDRAKNTYGTGCFLLRPSGPNAVASKHHLLTSLACSTDQQLRYAVEGSVFIGGAVIQWLRDQLKLIPSASDSETLAQSVSDNGGVYLVPAFAGLGAPHWDPHARGTICGLTRDSNAGHICRAALESIALQSADLLEAFNQDFGNPLEQLRVDGGAAKNNFLMQFQADIMQIPVVRPMITETTALGAAYLAGLATGFWKNCDSLESQWQIERRFDPQIGQQKAAELKYNWRRALERAKNWSE